MNLLVVLPAYEPAWAFGGVVRCMSTLCRALTALGHRVTVYTIDTDGLGAPVPVPGEAPLDLGGVHTYYFPATLGAGCVWDSRALVRTLSQTVTQFQVVYLAAIWQWLGPAVAACCRRHRVPLVAGVHGSLDRILLRRSRWRKRLFWHTFLHRALRRAAALHLTTAHERRETQALLSGFPSFVVPNPVDDDYFRPLEGGRNEFRQRHRLPAAAPVVVSVGRPDPKKRGDLLIRGLASHPDLYLLMVGPTQGEVCRNWQNLAGELNVADRIVWTGFLQGDELVRAYAAADLFALISEDENFGNVVVEAMACGLPVLVTRRVGVWDEIKAAAVGLAVAPHGAEVDRALGEFLQNRPLWAAWGKNGRGLARERYAPHRVATVMAQALCDVLTGSRSAACRWQEGSP